MSKFVHLHVHSHYSLLDSTVKLADLVAAAQADNMSAVALTDHVRMSGALELQNRARRTNVRAIHGAAIQVPPLIEENLRAKPDHQLVLLAQNLEGYKNLLHIVSNAWHDDSDRYYGPAKDLPRANWDLIRQHAAGLICLTGDLGGEIPTWILRRQYDLADRVAQELQSIFGEENLYLELQRIPGLPEQEDTCEALIEMSRRLKIPVVATNNVHYLKKGDHTAHGILTCIGLEKRVTPEMLELLPVKDLYFKSQEEMIELFADIPEAIQNTVKIADRCDVIIPTGEYFLPDFEVPEGFDINTYMHDRALEGLHARFQEIDDAGDVGYPYNKDVYLERLEMECNVISSMGYAGYFLIVWDFIAWAREQNIPVGPGRGSGAGSIVAWALRITDIDPMRYSLLFERFLNPERVSMPDFDIDFCQNRRAEVIQYVTEKYTPDNVGLIMTFGQLKAKAVVRDVARVLNLPMAETNRIAAMIPADPASKDTLGQYADKIPELKEAFQSDEQHELLFENCLAIEGTVRNSGVHAAGVVIGGSELWNYVPVILSESGELITQFAKDEVEQAGLVKFDFLGLKNLTVIQDALQMIERAHGVQVDFNKIDLNDPPTYEIIQRGDTAGIFQMESEGFQRLMKKLRPTAFEDLIAAVALYRPGPLGSGMVDTYIDCKHGRKEPDYLHPLLEEILKETFGVMVYQEQVMQAAQVMAGYSLGGADLLRRAMGKKLDEEMAKQRAQFSDGAAQNGVDPAKAAEIFDLIAHFAGYGFNKSHSAAYAMVSFQTAYLKAHYPAAFYAALMTSDSNRADKVANFILNARQRGITVLPPDINQSDLGFTVVEGAIRFGLGAIKGLGEGPIEEIVQQRKDQPFTSLFDFCERVGGIVKKQIESLISAGAFDSLYLTADGEPSLHTICRLRAQLAATVDAAVSRGAQARDDRASGQGNLLDMFGTQTQEQDEKLHDAHPWIDSELLRQEKELLSVYVSGHPFARYVREARLYADHTTQGFTESDAEGRGKKVRIAGMIENYALRTTKNDKRMADFRLEDLYGEIRAVIFPRTFEEIDADLSFDEPVIVTGMLRRDERSDEFEPQLIVDSIETIASVREGAISQVRLSVDAEQVEHDALELLWNVFDEHQGNCSITMELRYHDAIVKLDLPETPHVESSDAFIRAAESILGEGSVVLAS